MSQFEIAVHEYEDAALLAHILIDNNYVVMISKEEQLYIVSAIWSGNCDRNNVVFMDRCEFEEKYIEVTNDDVCADY